MDGEQVTVGPPRPPLHELEQVALTDSKAAHACAAMYGERVAAHQSDTYRTRLAGAYLLGLSGMRNPYEHRRGGNFAAGLRSAWDDGHRLRKKLQDAAASASPSPATE